MPRMSSRFGPRPAEVAARIKQARTNAGLTQEQAASLLGIDRGTYKNLENVANPQMSTLIALKSIGLDLKVIAPEIFGD